MNQEIKNTQVRLCLDCGKCTVVCPIAQSDSDFNPRLITQRILGGKSDGPQDDSIWSCINCYMCVERCNYRVDFPEFINALRCEACTEGYQVKCSHGGALQSLMHIMARQDLRQDRLGWLPQDIKITDECDTLFFVGCSPYFDAIFRELDINTLAGVKDSLRLLNWANVPFRLLQNERCCAHDLLVQGDRKGFMALAHANMEEFTRQGLKRIVTNCPECHHTLKVHYPKMLKETGPQVLHLTEIIAPLLQNGKIRLGNIEKTVTYHDPCMLGRCARVFDEPRSILSSIDGIELREMEQSRETSLCCGGSPWAHCGAINREIQERRLNQARETGADTLVTACPNKK
ncbi:MAG: (Fe-S)-binding protein, partial [Chloroflexota bacterium]|nr:(Fe-S)-binding protein [Chloroflexota bacterium]